MPNLPLLGAAHIGTHLTHIKLSLHISYMAPLAQPPPRIERKEKLEQIGSSFEGLSLKHRGPICISIIGVGVISSGSGTIKEMTVATLDRDSR